MGQIMCTIPSKALDIIKSSPSIGLIGRGLEDPGSILSVPVAEWSERLTASLEDPGSILSVPVAEWSERLTASLEDSFGIAPTRTSSLVPGTYFSENALLPGLVKGDFDEDMTAKNYQLELLEESSRYPNSMPYPWLLAKFRQLSLDVYTHNFTLNYPLGYGTKYTGKNVYAILRAPRSASTEALVLSVPYRPPSSAHPGTMPSIALMLSLAKFFRRQKYWAKDVIFLVTEHEQLGIQAWLEAYHQTTCGRSGVLDHGDMTGRGGAIQAAINLELHAEKIGHVDVKVEGLNGQLPNLDLVNLVHRMCSKEGVKHTFKNRENSNHRDPVKEWFHQLKTLMAMVTTQATGIPNGNHGLFHRLETVDHEDEEEQEEGEEDQEEEGDKQEETPHTHQCFSYLVHRFGIEAVTLEGFEKKEKGSPAVFYQLGREIGSLKSLEPFFCVHVSVGEGETELARLSQQLGEGETELARLYQQLGEGETELACLYQQLGEGETELAHLSQQLGEGETELAHFVMEGLFRSLNNLLERFHQSYFFYLQPTTDRYISIGMYMPPLGLLCAALLIKAFGLWLRMQKDPADSASAPTNQKRDTDNENLDSFNDKKVEDVHEVDKAEKSKEGDRVYSVEQQVVNFSLVPVGVAVLATHVLGVALLSAPRPFTTLGLQWGGLATETSIYVGYLVAALVMILVPLLASSIGGNMESWTLLNIVALLELATLLLAVSMHNFSLALLAAAIYAPPALWMTPAKNRFLSLFQKFLWLLLHPLLLLTIVVSIFTLVTFSELPWDEVLDRSLGATKQALVFAIIDSSVYGNWVFSVATAILTPNWLIFWLVLNSKPHKVKD
uniref:Glycosylphosphatidylinositol anchor attachment 1 protein n=1 Tax=Timema tahoe TaxID=61484 RepID=A0A7R9ILD0_9NEOP|nr:unnamed protein product [Timema tahoe]